MARTFAQTMSALRKARHLSQRTAAADLNISQALLSHYENGAREPGLEFVCRACRYFGVSADYLLGLTNETDNSPDGKELTDIAAELDALTRRLHTALEGENQ